LIIFFTFLLYSQIMKIWVYTLKGSAIRSQSNVMYTFLCSDHLRTRLYPKNSPHSLNFLLIPVFFRCAWFYLCAWENSLRFLLFRANEANVQKKVIKQAYTVSWRPVVLTHFFSVWKLIKIFFLWLFLLPALAQVQYFFLNIICFYRLRKC